ncbi:MAG TPA: tetratricopeptide repeat protein, partial [Lacunisphaera sp.]|nr:tetratricopeptide repeat protein [Lacunisphaera sp.]
AAKVSNGAAEYAEGDGHFKKKEYTKAFAAWKKSVDLGYAPAFADLGLLYQLGTGCEQNRAEARRLYQQGAAKNDPDAMLQLAHDLRDSANGLGNQAQAKYWYTRLVAHSAVKPAHRQIAQEALARMGGVVAAVPPGAPPLPAAPPAPKVAAAPSVTKPAAISALPVAKPGQAEFDQASAKIASGQIQEAVPLYELAAAKGHPGAMMNLYEAYFFGLGAARDYDKAVTWLKKAASTGDTAAVAELKKINAELQAGAIDHQKGMDLYKGKKVKEAVALWEKAAAQGHVPAMVELGFTLENGEGDVAANPAAALRWFERAAEKNDLDGLLSAGRAYLAGKGVTANLAKAREYFEKARTVGATNPKAVAAANAELAVLKGETPENALTVGFATYQEGKFEEALKWFRKSSDGGNNGATFNIGLLHERGEGVPEDPAEALAWFEKSKAQGNTKTDAAIARVKPRLLGLDDLKKANAAQQAKQYATARASYEKAAGAGNVAAMRKLAEIHQRGIAVVKNNRTALAWYEKAASAGDDFAADEAYSLRQEIEMWESNLRMAQMAGAIDGVKSPVAGARPGPAVPPDSLIKNSPWTVAELVAAIKSRADAEALAVAIRTDGVVDLYAGDHRRMRAIQDGTPILEFGNLNGALGEHAKPGAGKWARDVAAAAIAARRAQLNLPPPVVDTPALRARAVAGDVEAIYQLTYLGESERKLGPLPPEVTASANNLRDLVRKANYRPGFWLLGQELEYNSDAKKVDRAQAADYFRQAAEAGDARGAEKLAGAFQAPLDGGIAPNWFEVEYWLLEAAARARPGDFPVMPPEEKLYLLYSSAKPVGSGFDLLARPEDLRWLRELIRRGGPVGEYAAVILDNLRRSSRSNIDAMLKALPPEVPAFAADEVAHLEAAARAGNVDAMLKLADALATGYGMRQHDKRAFDYHVQAAQKGSVPAMKKVAQHYESGFGVKKDPEQRLAWKEKAAAAGGPQEAYELVFVLGKDDPVRVLALLEKAIAGNVDGAAELLAGKYQYGFDGFERNDDKAIAILLRAAEKGNRKVAGRLAGLYNAKQDYDRAVTWYRQAWDAGNKTVGIELARALVSAKRPDEANALYKLLAEEGSADGQYMYASSLEQTNPAEAYVWHKKLAANPGAGSLKQYGEKFIREYEEELKAAPGSDLAIRRQAKTGDTAAMLEYAKRIAAKDRDGALSWVYWAGNKGDVTAMLMLVNELYAKDKDHALGWLQKAIDAGSTQAMVMRANHLMATDQKAGLEWLQKAEAQGNADAKFQIGGLHYQGRGMAQDQARGVEMMLAAAEAGSLPAQFEMGRAYMQGMPGLPADQAKGLALLKKAADANVPQAAAMLGEIHERGVGTPQNLEEAHKYYRKAVALGLTQVKAKADQLESMLMKGMGGRPKK